MAAIIVLRERRISEFAQPDEPMTGPSSYHVDTHGQWCEAEVSRQRHKGAEAYIKKNGGGRIAVCAR